MDGRVRVIERRKIDGYIDDLLTEADTNVRAALEYVVIAEEEHLRNTQARLRVVRRTISRISSRISQLRRPARTPDDDAERAKALLEPLASSLRMFQEYELRCLEANASGPALPAEALREKANAALDAVILAIRPASAA